MKTPTDRACFGFGVFLVVALILFVALELIGGAA